MNNEESQVSEAVERLKKARDKIIAKKQKSNLEEPKSLVSGHLDEVEIKRRDKGINNND